MLMLVGSPGSPHAWKILAILALKQSGAKVTDGTFIVVDPPRRGPMTQFQ